MFVSIGGRWYQASVRIPVRAPDVRFVLAGDAVNRERTAPIAAVLCGGGVRSEGAPPNEFALFGPGDPGGTTVSATTALQAGQRVQYASSGNWYEAVITALDASGAVTVRALGYRPGAAESVERRLLRVGGTVRSDEPMPGERRSAPMPSITGGRPVRANTVLSVGQAVNGRANGVWMRGVVHALGGDGRVSVREVGTRWNISWFARRDLRLGGVLSED